MTSASNPISEPTSEPLALYVHWPWCLSKCPYCDFNSHAVDGELDHAVYVASILAELEHYASKTNGRTVASIFFGGGTPSLMDPDTVHAIIDTAKNLWGLSPGCEITLEANPTSVEAAKFRAFQGAGINRVSIGVQALKDEALQQLGREHSARDAHRAVDIAGAVFDRFTFDIIYARPGQGLGEWHDELEHALSFAGDHLSLYQLTIEPGTAFFKQRVPQSSPELGAELYELTQAVMGEAGLPAYEISNHAKPGQESRHNLTYWQGGDYIGVGPGAHGRLTTGGVTQASHQIADPARWLKRVALEGHGTAKARMLSATERAEELLLSGLRLSDGIERARFLALAGQDVTACVDGAALAMVQDEGLVELTDQRIRVTPGGRLVLSAILEKLLS